MLLVGRISPQNGVVRDQTLRALGERRQFHNDELSAEPPLRDAPIAVRLLSRQNGRSINFVRSLPVR
jgi:hypothetical protein